MHAQLQYDAKELKKCSKCRLVSYCSTECQKKHWVDVHKEDCKILRNARKSMKDEDDSRLPDNKTDRVFSLMERAGRYMQRGELDAAERDYRRLIDVEDFRTVGSYTNLGSILMMKRRPTEAIPHLKIAVTLPPLESPNEARVALEMLANAYGMSGNRAEQKATWEAALRKWPGDPQFKAMLETA